MNGSVSMAYDEYKKHSVIIFTVQGKVYHYYVRDGVWIAEQFPMTSTGDIATVYEKQRQSVAFFSRGEDGNLRYTYMFTDAGFIYSTYHWKTSDCYQVAGQVGGRICTVYESHRNHCACFFVGDDQRIHYFYAINGVWQYESFGSDIPCTGDLTVCYDESRNYSAFCYESNGKLQFYYFEKKQWHRIGSDVFKHPVAGCMSMVYDRYRKSVGIFYTTTNSKLVYYYNDSGVWKTTEFKEIILGDVKAIWNSDTQHVEVLYLSTGGLQQYYGVYSYISGYSWGKVFHPFDCCSNIDAVYQPNRKHIEFFFISPDTKRNFIHFNGTKFQLTTNEKALCWDQPHLIEMK